MATRVLLRIFPRSLTKSSNLSRFRPIAAISAPNLNHAAPAVTTNYRGFSTCQTMSSSNDSNPNPSNQPPYETKILDGCDFEHWLVIVETPQGEPSRDEIIDSYINTLAKVVGSYDEARMKIYSVSTRCYFAFGALVSEEDSYKLHELPGVRWVLPDSYLDVKNKDYGGEPFIDGKAVPYDPKYHEEFIRNSLRANERSKIGERLDDFYRSSGFEEDDPGLPNMAGPSDVLDQHMLGGPPQSDMDGGMADPPPPNMGGGMGGPPPPIMAGLPSNMGGQPQDGGGPPPNYQQQQGQYGPNSEGMPHQSGPEPNSYPPNTDGANLYQNQDLPGTDTPPKANYE